MKILNNTADIEIPEDFKEATIGEKRRVYGMGMKISDEMFVEREQHVFVSAFEHAMKKKTKSNTELAQGVNFIYSRTVPGYNCIGIYKKKIAGKEIHIIQYTSYTLKSSIYTMAALWSRHDVLCMLNCVCDNNKVPEFHPVFQNIVESIVLE